MLDSKDLRLDEFGEHLLKASICGEEKVRYYVMWVRRFFRAIANWPPDEWPILLQRFIDDLQTNSGVEGWQAAQAEHAVRLYFSNFRSGEGLTGASHVKAAADGSMVVLTLLATVREALRVRRYSYRTEQTYTDWIRRFIIYVDQRGQAGSSTSAVRGRPVQARDNTQLPVSVRFSQQEVRDYLAWLAIQQHVAAATQNQAWNSLLFMCREVLKWDMGDMRSAVRAKRGPKLPVVLTPEETMRLLDAAEGTDSLMLETIYSGGLRLMELCRLRVKDVDFDNELIFVRDGKGGKDRTTLLSHSLIPRMREHIGKLRELHEKDTTAGCAEVYMPNALGRKYQNAAGEFGWQWMFPSAKLSVDPRAGKVRRHHISPTHVQNTVARAAARAGIEKPVSPHTLRHAFATHLLLRRRQ